MILVLLGYAAILAYVFFLIFVLGTFVQKKTNTETSRKIIHTMLFLVWVLIDVFFRHTVHQIIVPIIFLLLNALSLKFKIYKSVEREENDTYGTVFFAIAITAVMTVAYFFPQFYYPSGIASFCLTFGDGFAAIVGYNTRSKKVRHSKSLNGSLSCIAASFVSVLLFRVLYHAPVSVAGAVVIAVAAAIFELVDQGLDNFSVTFSAFLCSFLLMNDADGKMTLCIALAELIFLVVYFSASLTYYGALLSMGMVFCFWHFGGGFGILYLLGTFFTIFLISAVKKHCLHVEKKEKARNFIQIAINGGLGTLFIILFGLLGQERFLYLSVVAIGGCFVDSVSSDVGVLSKKAPYDPLHRRVTERGMSGGMSVLGTLSALLASAIIGAVTACVRGSGFGTAALLTALIFLQTLVDTVLGAAWQVRFTCAVCGKVTEKREHCAQKTVYRSGVRWMDNNMVNLLSSVLITALAMLVL